MATVPFDYMSLPTDAVSGNGDDSPQTGNGQMHRIRTVRLQQGVSLRTAARQMGTDIRSLRQQENENADLRLSDLHEWQKALDVPVTELMVEPDNSTLSPPIMQRARMVRLMKTAAALMESAADPGVERLAENLVNQLTEIMPELKDVAPWHTYGQRRSLDEVGRVAERCIPSHMIESGYDD